MFAAAGSTLRSILKSVGSLLAGSADQSNTRASAADARLIQPWRDDSLRSHPSVGLTPARALAFVHAADAGRPAELFELYDEMLQKWPRLAAVEATRRLALTGLEWDLAAPWSRRGSSLDGGGGSAGGFSDDDPRAANDERTGSSKSKRGERASNAATVEFCKDQLTRLNSFDAALDHLAVAIGHGLAVAEIVWEQGRVVDVVPVPHSRLIAGSDEPWRLRVLTDEHPTDGAPLDVLPNKWIVHRPRSSKGATFGGGLLRASLLLYVAQNLSFKDWLVYSQLAGMPVRVAHFEPGTPESDRKALLNMLESLGTDAVAVLSKAVDLKLLETARGGEKPYQAIQDYCNTECRSARGFSRSGSGGWGPASNQVTSENNAVRGMRREIMPLRGRVIPRNQSGIPWSHPAIPRND